MRVRVTEDSVEVQLSRWQKILGLMRSITVPIADVSEVRIIEDPFSETKGTGLKAGLRLPRLYYVARTIGLDQAFLVRRGMPAISFAVRNQDPLKRVLASTPEAEQLVRRLKSPRSS